ncbi:hypothetical protein PG989_000489 [Apiospora arundinis]
MKLDLSWKKRRDRSHLPGRPLSDDMSVVRFHALIDLNHSTEPDDRLCEAGGVVAGGTRSLREHRGGPARGSQNASSDAWQLSRPGFACNGITKTTVVSVQCHRGGSDDDSESEVELVQRSRRRARSKRAMALFERNGRSYVGYKKKGKGQK